MKAKILQNRGTTSSITEVKAASWAGKEFVKYSLKKISSLSPEAKFVTHHGTSSVTASKYPKYSRVIPESGVILSTGRGPGTIRL